MLIFAGSATISENIVKYLQKTGEEVRYYSSQDIPLEDLKKAELVLLFGDDHEGLLQHREKIKSLNVEVLCYTKDTVIREDGDIVVDSLDHLLSLTIKRQIETLREKNFSLRLLDTVKTCTEGLNIFVHDNPDPDALGSAMALEAVCREAGIDSKAYYGGEIGYTENQLFLDRTGFEIEKIISEDLHRILKKGDIAFLDFARSGENNMLPPGTEAKIIIDHHYTNKDVDNADFVDIQSVGATSTLMTKHLQRSEIAMDPLLASALLYGIKVDTKDYTRNIGPSDFEAISYLTSRADGEMLSILDSTPMDSDALDAMGYAISKRKIYDGVMTAFAGTVKQRDHIPQVADMLEGESEVNTVLVMGIFQDKIHMSARSKDPRLNLGKTMKELYDDVGSAGGHRHSAGGNIPTSKFKNKEDAVDEISRIFREGVIR